MFLALAKLGAVFAPLNARGSLEELAPVAEYAQAAPAVRWTLRTPKRAPSSPAGPACPSSPPCRIADSADRPAGGTRRTRSARHLLHERKHGTAERRRAFASRRTGCAPTSARHPLRAAPEPSACSRSSTWPDGRLRWARGKRGARCISCAPPMPKRCCGPPNATAAARLYCIPAVWARILEHGVGALRPLRARRSRHRYVGDAARAVARDQGRAAAHRPRASSTARPKPGPACNSGMPTCSASRAASGSPQPGVDVR